MTEDEIKAQTEALNALAYAAERVADAFERLEKVPHGGFVVRAVGNVVVIDVQPLPVETKAEAKVDGRQTTIKYADGRPDIVSRYNDARCVRQAANLGGTFSCAICNRGPCHLEPQAAKSVAEQAGLI